MINSRALTFRPAHPYWRLAWLVACGVAVAALPVAPARSAPAALTMPVVEVGKWKIEFIGAVVHDPALNKLYVGTRSRDEKRHGLMVFDVKPDGKVEDDPRRYSDSLETLPFDHWAIVNAIMLDKKHHKLWLGVGDSHGLTVKTLTVYDLDDKGEPTGEPKTFANGNPNKATNVIALHPRLNRLYVTGFGGSGYYTLDLGDDGLPNAPAVEHPVGGVGKYSMDIRADGSKIYLGTYPYTLEVADLDANGNTVGKPRTYPIAGGPQQYLMETATDRAIYFKGADGRLNYFSLNATGEPVGLPKNAGGQPVQAIALSPQPGRLLLARDEGFWDALKGKWITSGVRVEERALAPDGAPGEVTRSGPPLTRFETAAFSSQPGIALATNHKGWAFLGNRFAGFKLRATLLDVAASQPLLPAAQSITLSPQTKYIRIRYSPSHSMVYSTGENVILAYDLKGPAAKPVAVPAPEVGDPIALDDAAGMLYVARKDGSVTMRKLDENGLPEEQGRNLQTGIAAIGALAINPQTHHLYVVGSKGAAATATWPLPAGARIIPVPASGYQGDAVVSAAQGRLYSVSTYNANENLWVWKLAADGTLASPEPKHYADGFVGKNEQGTPLRGSLSAVRIDAKRRKLYMAGQPEQLRPGLGVVVVYDLDDQGDPTGTPRLYPSPNTAHAVAALALSPDGKWLYEGGFADPRFFSRRLDDKGEPSKDAKGWPLGGIGKFDFLVTPDGSKLLSGTYPSNLEIVSLQKNGDPVGGAKASFSMATAAGGAQTVDLGILSPGSSSAWINLDEGLKDGNGTGLARLTLQGVPVTHSKWKLEMQLSDVNGQTPLRTTTVDLDGGTSAFFLPRYGVDDSTPSNLISMIETSAERFRKYLSYAQEYALPPDERPKKFLVANGVIGLDSSKEALEAGVAAMELLGHNNLQIWGWPDIAPAAIHAVAAQHGVHRFRGAVYNPPSYFAYDIPKVQPAFLDKWAQEQTAFAKGVGAQPQDVTLMHMADEPGWYYPYILNEVKAKPERLANFRDYLKSKGMTPELVGSDDWDQVVPLGLSQAKSLPKKRLLFWTARFYAESLSLSFHAATAALQRALSPKLLTTTNLNNWPGRFFVPSPGVKIANNSDTGPDAAEGMPDWFDLGRKKAVSCIWTEDWFGDADAQQWSFNTDLMRCAAREGPVEYGAYVVGQSTGAMPEVGGKYKIMSLMGHGAKALDPYIFGPNPAFGDGWSDGKYVYHSLSRGMRMLGKSERLLYPGRPRNSSVAILFPQASQVWDADYNLRFYLSELYGLHAALIHESYAVDFVDDFGVEAGDLQKYNYSVLYVTAPNLSEKVQQAILEFARRGGTVVLSPGAAVADEYNEPSEVLWQAAGARRATVPRLAVPRDTDLVHVKPVTLTLLDPRLGSKEVLTKYQIAPLEATGAKALATFADGKAALVALPCGKGRILALGLWPGVTYWNSPDRTDRTRFPQGWDSAARRLITAAARFAKAPKQVDVSSPLVEATLLESKAGIAVTLLNWSGAPLANVTVTVPHGGKFAKTESVEQGTLTPQSSGGDLKVSLPLDSVDVLMLTR